MFKGDAIEKFHGYESLIAELSNFINGADVGMIQRGSGASFTAKAFQGLRIAGDVVGEKLQSDEAAEFRVFGFINDTHASAAEFFNNAVVRNGLANHVWARTEQSCYERTRGSSTKA